MDLSSLTVAQLRDLQQQIPAELKRREAQEKVNILNEVRAFAKARATGSTADCPRTAASSRCLRAWRA